MRKRLSLPQHSPLTSLVAMILATIFLAGCGFGGQRREVINYTSYTFCKVEERPNLSIYAPWQKKTRRIELPPNGSITIRDRGKDYILSVWSCDGRYMISNYNHRPEPGEPWYLGESDVWDSQREHIPKPKPTRTPAVVTIKNGTEKDIRSIELSLRKKPYKFSLSILDDILQDGAQIVLYEPQDIKYSTNVLKITFCDGNEYITQQVTFSDIITITLRGEEQDTRDLLVEREKAK